MFIITFIAVFYWNFLAQIRKGSAAPYPGKVGRHTGPRPNCIARSATRAARTMACASGSIPPPSCAFCPTHEVISRTSVNILFVSPHSGRFFEIFLLPAPLALTSVDNFRRGRHIEHPPMPSRAVFPSDLDEHPMTPLVKRCIQIARAMEKSTPSA